MNNLIIKKVILVAEPAPEKRATMIDIALGADDLSWGLHSLIPAVGYDAATVDWGDGSREIRGGVAVHHDYAASGGYTVTLGDQVEELRLSLKSSTYRGRFAKRVTAFRSTSEKLVTLMNNCFDGCENLMTVEVPNVATLGAKAFYNCTALKQVRLPKVVNLDTSDGDGSPFAGCTGLEEIHFAAANEAAIKASVTYQADPTLGSGSARVLFDL